MCLYCPLALCGGHRSNSCVQKLFVRYLPMEHARRCYFCSEECVVAAVRVYIGTHIRTLPEEAWETYELASFTSLTALPESKRLTAERSRGAVTVLL